MTKIVSGLQYTILLPDFDYSDLEALCHIMYGLDVAVPRSSFDNIFALAELLGIAVGKLRYPERFLLDPNEPRLAKRKRITISSSDAGTAPAPQVELEVEDERDPLAIEQDDGPEAAENMPLCCFHCSESFSNLEALQKHAEAHKGETFKSKRHKCQKCKKVYNLRYCVANFAPHFHIRFYLRCGN